jgi:hypothetical protein
VRSLVANAEYRNRRRMTMGRPRRRRLARLRRKTRGVQRFLDAIAKAFLPVITNAGNEDAPACLTRREP